MQFFLYQHVENHEKIDLKDKIEKLVCIFVFL